MHATAHIPGLVLELTSIVNKLEQLFPGRKFTLDGHLLGSIGEVLAAALYALELLPSSAERHDAKASDGRLVQIKATQTTRVGLRSQPEHLLVLQLEGTSRVVEIYNGPGVLAWEQAGKRQRNGQCSVSGQAAGADRAVKPKQRLAACSTTGVSFTPSPDY